ncbi:hypothetical protein ABIB82_007760 [Bradyrhizobium sp. i1.8.4]
MKKHAFLKMLPERSARVSVGFLHDTCLVERPHSLT